MRWLGRSRERAALPESPLGLGDEAPPRTPAGPDAGDDGAVWVEAGAVRVRNPLRLGRWPVIQEAGGGAAALRVNGEMLQGEAVVRAEDEITVDGLGEVLVPGSVDVGVLDGEMAAEVTIRPEVRRIMALEDTDPALRLAVRYVERLVPTGRGLDLPAVREALRQAGVTAEPDTQAVAQALAAPGTAVIVARGRQARPGRSPRLWSVMLPDGEWDVEEWAGGRGLVTDAGVYVEAGQPVVLITPGEPAEDGQTVTGLPLAAVQPRRLAWSLGPGILLSADESTAIAARAGRPEVVIGQDHIHVAVYVADRVTGDVAPGNGPLTFDGDVRIEGGVQAGSTICARGNIEVQGDVAGAQLLAGGHVIVQGAAVGARLAAGASALRYAAALPACHQLASALEQMDRADVAAERVQDLCARLQKALDGGPGSGLTDDVGALHRLLPVLASTAGTLRPDQARLAAGILREAAQIMQRGALRSGVCRIHHLQRCRVDASGAGEVGSAGVYMCEITTMAEAHVEGPVRGGRIRAEGGVRVEEAGSEGEVPTRFDIGTGAVFEAGTVYPGTVVTSGGRSYKFSVETKGIRLTEGDLNGPARQAVPAGPGMLQAV